MKKTLTSIITLCIACQALAGEPDIPAGTENPSCNGNVLKTTSGSVNLVANWTPVTYTEPAGKYLLYDSQTDTITQDEICLENNYCPGFTDSEFTGTSMGIYACSNNKRGKTEYQYSDAGTTTDAACYKTGTMSCATHTPYFAAHGTAEYVTTASGDGYAGGRMYLGQDKSTANDGADESTDVKLDNVSECNIANVQCDAGYTLSDVEFGVLYPYVRENALFHERRSRNLIGENGWNFGDQTGLNNGDWVATYQDGTQINGIATCIDTDNGSAALGDFFDDNIQSLATGTMSVNKFASDFLEIGNQTQLDAIMALLPLFMAGYVNWKQGGVVWDKVRRSVPGDTYSQAMTGQYCWCKLTGYKLAGENSTHEDVSDSRWRYTYLSDIDRCQYDCATNCAREFEFDHLNEGVDEARFTIFGDLASFPTCEPNTINLNWNAVGNVGGETGLQFANDGGGMCTYDGTITLPTPPTKTGYTFNGWNVSVVEQSDVPQDPEPQQPKP